MFPLLFAAILFVLLLQIPQYFVKNLINKHNNPNENILGTGGQFLHHLKNKYSLSKLEIKSGSESFYNPKTKQIYLEEKLYNVNSVSAITIAAHEFAHAMQDNQNSPSFIWRNILAQVALMFRYLSVMSLLLTIMGGIFANNRLLLLLSVLIYLLPGVIHLLFSILTLPVEWDASFNRAYPLLAEGNYIQAKELKNAKTILSAAFWSYLTVALANFFNLFRFRLGYRK